MTGSSFRDIAIRDSNAYTRECTHMQLIPLHPSQHPTYINPPHVTKCAHFRKQFALQWLFYIG